ncbi:hypothetical protein PR048_027177 [Dryococelus australis]|uniref:Uncharacterized protein n=1 Tax=Dryococelus australis TaxID=614101 RepID=A0ABQ9GEP4_9NEOP|nr:hypothetical protein PR048_027177 [Dryococelus australis]
MKERGKQEIPEKTRRPAASSGEIPTFEISGVAAPGIEPGSPCGERRAKMASVGKCFLGVLVLVAVTSAGSSIFSNVVDMVLHPKKALVRSCKPTRVIEVSMEQHRNEMGGKREIPEKTRRPASSSGTIPTCENPEVTRPGIEPGSPWWEASRLTFSHSGTFQGGVRLLTRWDLCCCADAAMSSATEMATRIPDAVIAKTLENSRGLLKRPHPLLGIPMLDPYNLSHLDITHNLTGISE